MKAPVLAALSAIAFVLFLCYYGVDKPLHAGVKPQIQDRVYHIPESKLRQLVTPEEFEKLTK